MKNPETTVRTALLVLLAVACTDAPPEAARESAEPEATDAPTATTLEAATALGVRNARMPAPGLITAGQPTPEQLDGLARAGFTRFISLRPATEDGAGWEEAHAAREGLTFERLPISGADDLTRENAEALARLLDEAGEGTVLYCGSGNRVGALMALEAHWVDGAPAEEAFELGRSAGMTRLAEPVRGLLGLEPEG